MATKSEAALWVRLRGKQLGVRFRRQVPLLDSYIVDFIALTPRLIVEVDGGYHGARERHDRIRDHRLALAGYRILRLPATLVLTDMPAALALILASLQLPRRSRPKT